MENKIKYKKGKHPNSLKNLNLIPWNKGKKIEKLSKEHKKKIGESNRGKHSETMKKLWQNPEYRKHMSEIHKGKIYAKSKIKRGHSWNYIDGRSKLKSPARYGDDWDKIRYLVYLRDKFTCQDCGIKGIRLDIHHIIPFLISFDNSLNNLITLCRKCHMKRELKLKWIYWKEECAQKTILQESK